MGQGMPAIFFRYELSPIRIQYTVQLQNVTTFLVKICAIIGGIYTVSSIFESLLRNSISIFYFGSLDDYNERNMGPPKKAKMKKVSLDESVDS